VHQETIGEHTTWVWPVLGTVHKDTILTTWVAMVLALAFFWWVGASYRSNRVSKRQATFEGIIQFLSDLAVGTLGPTGERYVPIFVGIFFFIWILNEFGVLFVKAFGLPFGGSPTADLNTTAAFALCVFFGIQFLAIRKSGIRAYAHLFQPYWFLFPINLIEEIARQPEARGNIFTFFFLGVGILEAFPIIGLVLGFYLFFVVGGGVAGMVAKLLGTH